MKVTDEMLMALADGELDPETGGDVARAVSADPVLQSRLAEFETTRILAKQAFAGVLEETVPPRLVAVAGSSGRGRGRQGRGMLLWWPAGASAAAGLAGFVLAGLLGEAEQHAPAAFPDTREIAALLESTPSGETVNWPGTEGASARSFAALGSFAVPAGICRTFALTVDMSEAVEWRGVACHQGEMWSVEILVAGAAPGQSGFFSTASERATQSIDAFLDAMGAGGAIDAAEEARLIAGGWQTEGDTPE